MDDQTITFKGFYYFSIVNTSKIILKGGGHVRVQSGMTSLVTVQWIGKPLTEKQLF